MKQRYLEAIHLIERLHRQFMAVLAWELARRKLHDINNVQALMLYNIGEDELSVGELTHRGCYLGSNVSYNIGKMVESGYVEQERSAHDRRIVRVRLSKKGLEMRRSLDAIFERHCERLQDGALGQEALGGASDSLLKLERFWSRGMAPGGGSV